MEESKSNLEEDEHKTPKRIVFKSWKNNLKYELLWSEKFYGGALSLNNRAFTEII